MILLRDGIAKRGSLAQIMGKALRDVLNSRAFRTEALHERR